MTTANHSRAKPTSSDAIALLTADHRAVKKLYKHYQALMEDGADAAERGEVAQRICTALTAHAAAEEEIFYPAVREAINDDDLMDEADIEHASAKDLIAQIQAMNPGDDKYDARVIVLCEYIQHHVKEEENEMFVKARKARGLDMQQLGEQLAARKAGLTGASDRDDDEVDADDAPASRTKTQKRPAMTFTSRASKRR